MECVDLYKILDKLVVKSRIIESKYIKLSQLSEAYENLDVFINYECNREVEGFFTVYSETLKDDKTRAFFLYELKREIRVNNGRLLNSIYNKLLHLNAEKENEIE